MTELQVAPLGPPFWGEEGACAGSPLIFSYGSSRRRSSTRTRRGRRRPVTRGPSRSSPRSREWLWECLRTLYSRPTWRRRTSSRSARSRRTYSWPSPPVPPGRTTPARAAPRTKATPVPAGAPPSVVVPTVTPTSPSELDSFRKNKLIGGLTQAYWCDNAGLRTIASRRNRRRSSRNSDHP